MKRILGLFIACCGIASQALAAPHPLEPLSTQEIGEAVRLAEAAGVCPSTCYFPSVSLREPAKAALQGSHAALPREAMVLMLDREHSTVIELVVSLTTQRVVTHQVIPGAQPLVMIEELDSLPRIVRQDPAWQAAMRRRGITDFETVHVDAWAQGDTEPKAVPGARMLRALSFYPGAATNRYGRPIEGVVALVNMTAGKVERVLDSGVVPLAPDAQDFFDAAWIGPNRTAPKPLVPTQAQGPSFSLSGHAVTWQKWHFRYSLHPREGLVLYDVRYEDQGRLRSILDRAALSEMVVPYGDPDPNWSWRSAFDVGEYGVGRLASPLTRGADVPENATLLDADFADDFGRPYTAKDVVALYERDGGLLWKHYDIVTGRNGARRGRELVITFTTTVGNYDYALSWVFRQDGTLRVETDLTGIMLAKGVAPGATAHDPYAHLVAPGVAAPHHQHYFIFRLDFDVDGPRNRLVEMNTRALDQGQHNPRDNGIVMETRLLASEAAARRNMSLASARKWAVINASERNSLGQPTGYALVPGENTMPYAWPSCFARLRAGFIDYHVWGTRYSPEELYAAGDYPNQSLRSEGLPKWVQRDANLTDEDVVLWYSMGVTHVPRPEEWPVMPTHRVGFSLVPMGFFARNPALDVP
jgi:primary-amine oxidase